MLFQVYHLYSLYQRERITLDEYDEFVKTREQVLKEKRENGLADTYLGWQNELSDEMQKRRGCYEEKQKQRQSWIKSYEDDIVTPDMLRLIHLRRILDTKQEKKVEEFFLYLYKNYWCLENEKFFLERDQAGNFRLYPDNYDMEKICPFKEKHKYWGYFQCENPESM